MASTGAPVTSQAPLRKLIGSRATLPQVDLYTCRRCHRWYLAEIPFGRCPGCEERLAKVWMPPVPRAEPGSYPGGDRTYASMEDFVRDDLDRLSSREIDFGCSGATVPPAATERRGWRTPASCT